MGQFGDTSTHAISRYHWITIVSHNYIIYMYLSTPVVDAQAEQVKMQQILYIFKK